MQVFGGIAYVATDSAGLQIFRVPQNRLSQILVLGRSDLVAITESSLNLPATSSRGLPVAYLVVFGPAQIENDDLIRLALV